MPLRHTVPRTEREEVRLDRRSLLARRSGSRRGARFSPSASSARALLGERFALQAASAAGSPRVHRFASRPDLIPPKVTVVQRAGAAAPGLLFLGPSSGPGQRGAMIIDDDGEIVWFHPTVPNTVINFRAALYRGEPVLTWWEGKTKHGLGIGEHVVFDRTYRELARFPAGDGLESDLHELILTPVRHGPRDRVRHPHGRPLERRLRPRPGDRRDRAGARGAERARALRMAKPRSREAHGVVLEGCPGLRLLPRQLDRPRRRRQPARLGPEHVDRLQGRPRKREGDLAPRRQAQRLRDGPGDAVRLAARRPPPLGLRKTASPEVVDAVRQRRRSAGAAAVAWARRSRSTSRRCGRASSTPTCTARRCSRMRSGASRPRPTATSSSAGAPSRTSPSTRRTARSSSTRSSLTAARTTARSGSPGAPSLPSRPAWRRSRARRTSTRAGTAPPESTPGGCSAGPSPASLTARSTTPRTGFETTLPLPAGVSYAAAAALDVSGRSLGRSAPIKL